LYISINKKHATVFSQVDKNLSLKILHGIRALLG